MGSKRVLPHSDLGDTPPEVQRLAAEIFSLMQMSQGYFFVSDGETFPTVEEFFERLRGRLAWGQRACRDMRAFLKKYDALAPRTTERTENDAR